jgi:hypothetical protein
LNDKNKNYSLYSPSLEDKPFFEWPVSEKNLQKNPKSTSKKIKPAIIRPKVVISEKVIRDRIEELSISDVLNLIRTEFTVDEKRWRDITPGGDLYKWVGAGHQITIELVNRLIHQIFEEYIEKEKLKKERELKKTNPDVIVVNASELLHSKS